MRLFSALLATCVLLALSLLPAAIIYYRLMGTDILPVTALIMATLALLFTLYKEEEPRP